MLKRELWSGCDSNGSCGERKQAILHACMHASLAVMEPSSVYTWCKEALKYNLNAVVASSAADNTALLVT